MSLDQDVHSELDYEMHTQFEVERFLYREARMLDRKEFDQWLELFTDDVHYFMRLYEASHETVHLAVLDGTDVLYIEKIYGHNPCKAPTYVGSRMMSKAEPWIGSNAAIRACAPPTRRARPAERAPAPGPKASRPSSSGCVRAAADAPRPRSSC